MVVTKAVPECPSHSSEGLTWLKANGTRRSVYSRGGKQGTLTLPVNENRGIGSDSWGNCNCCEKFQAGQMLLGDATK